MLRSDPYALAMTGPNPAIAPENAAVPIVALDTGPLYGKVTGVGRSVLEVVAEMRRRPADVTVVPYVVSFRAPLEPGTRRLPYPAAVAVRSWGRCNHPGARRALAGVQLIHGTNFVVPPSDLPRLVTVHDCWALRHPDATTPAVNRAMRALRHAVEGGAHVHAPSRATAEGVREIFPKAAVTVVPWATPRIVESPGVRPSGAHWSEGTPLLTAVGTIDQRKNLVRLVAAFADLAGEFPELLLVLAGSPGNATVDVEQAIDALPPDQRHRVIRLGHLEADEIVWLHRHSSVIAYPSLDEGFGFPILEAMAVGTPVVAANSGSLPEIAGDAALLVDPLDVDGLAAAIHTALTDSATRRSLVEAGRLRHRHFSWPATADGLVELYRQLISTNSLPGAGSEPEE